MTKLKIILQSNKLFLIILTITLIITFLRINFIKNESILKDFNSFTGVITSINFEEGKYTINIKNKEEIIAYYNKDEDIDLFLGDLIKVDGEFYEPSNNTIPNTFNYKKYLNNRKIFYLVKVNKIILLKRNKNVIYKFKNLVVERANKLKNTKGYVKAFIIGDKTELDFYNTYQKNGVSHLFALSGMHISLLTACIYYLLKKCEYQNVIVIIFLLFYLSITNYSASLIRSIVFFILLKLNKKYDLNINTKNILVFTICILLLYNPYIIFDYGFLYSVTVTLGLIISSKYYKNNKYFYNLFITSIISFFFSLPISACLNYEINITSILNNLIVVPLISIIIYPLSLIVFLLQFLEPVLTFMILILEKINYILNIFCFSIIIPKVNIVFFLIYYIFLLLFIKSNNYKYLLLSIILILLLKFKPILSNYIYGYFLDVKQGDSALIRYHNKLILIDTGGISNYNVSDNTVKLIKSLGYNHLDLMVLTHGDYDHMGEAINLVNNFKVEKVIFNCGPYETLEKELIEVLNKKKIKYYSCIKELNIDKSKLYFLQAKIYDNENDNSNVIYTELNGYKFMFIGDASITTEKEIINKYNLSNIDVLKVGHHGSRTSSSQEFINEIKPVYSIISVGKNNRYGHPNKEVLENLNNSKIYRTDQDGSIMFKIKNNRLKIETWSP